MTDKHVIRSVKWIVHRQNEAIFENATAIEIEDEAAGEFITITQIYDDTKRQIVIEDVEHWNAIKQAVDIALECIILEGKK